MSNVKVVIGSSYGDEGKGLMTDYFAAEARKRDESCLIVLSNGGAQRGHTSTTPDGIRHVFHHFGSGTPVGIRTYFPEHFIVNPITFKKEFIELQNTVGDIKKPIVNRNCMVTTPFDMIANQIFEETRGNNKHGSCGMGIWETVRRCRRDSFKYGVYELCIERGQDTIRRMLKSIQLYYNDLFVKERIIMSDEWEEIWNNPELINHYIEDIYYFYHNTASKGTSNFIRFYDTVIFENAQGLCLDQYFGNDDRYTTPSNTGLTNPAEMIKRYMPDANVEVCYVTRTYLTRHGRGPMDHECDKSEINPDMVDLTNIPNPFQESLRFGKIRVDRLRDRVYSDFTIAEPSWKKSLAITHLNEYPWNFPELFKEFDVVYESNGQTRNDIYERRIN